MKLNKALVDLSLKGGSVHESPCPYCGVSNDESTPMRLTALSGYAYICVRCRGKWRDVLDGLKFVGIKEIKDD